MTHVGMLARRYAVYSFYALRGHARHRKVPRKGKNSFPARERELEKVTFFAAQISPFSECGNDRAIPARTIGRRCSSSSGLAFLPPFRTAKLESAAGLPTSNCSREKCFDLAAIKAGFFLFEACISVKFLPGAEEVRRQVLAGRGAVLPGRDGGLCLLRRLYAEERSEGEGRSMMETGIFMSHRHGGFESLFDDSFACDFLALCLLQWVTYYCSLRGDRLWCFNNKDTSNQHSVSPADLWRNRRNVNGGKPLWGFAEYELSCQKVMRHHLRSAFVSLRGAETICDSTANIGEESEAKETRNCLFCLSSGYGRC